MKSKAHKGDPAGKKTPGRPAQPSTIEVRDSWIEALGRSYPPEAETTPTLRSPAITLPDDALMVDTDDQSFPEYEGPTLPRAQVFRPLLGSLDERALLKELARPAAMPEPDVKEKRRSTTSPPARTVQELDLSSVRAFEDLTPEMQYLLLAEASERRVGALTAIPEFDTLLVVKGAVRIGLPRGQGMGGSWQGLVLMRGDVVTRRRGIDGLGDPVVLGGEPGTTVLVWHDTVVEQVLGLCPWIDDSLREEGDRVQTLLLLASKQRRGLWRELMRVSRLTRLESRVLSPGEGLIGRGERVTELIVVGFGEVELVDEDRVAGRISTGEFVFPTCVLSGASAPLDARAGPKGATVIAASAEVVNAAVSELPLLGRQMRGAS